MSDKNKSPDQSQLSITSRVVHVLCFLVTANIERAQECSQHIPSCLVNKRIAINSRGVLCCLMVTCRLVARQQRRDTSAWAKMCDLKLHWLVLHKLQLFWMKSINHSFRFITYHHISYPLTRSHYFIGSQIFCLYKMDIIKIIINTRLLLLYPI